MAQSGFVEVLISLLFYGIVHSLLAAHRTKNWAARTIGEKSYRRYYRLFFVFMAGLTLLPTLVLVAFTPDKTIYMIRFPLLVITSLIQLLAALGLLLAIRQTGVGHFLGLQQLRGQGHPEHTQQLSVDGYYRYVRHPLYAFSLIFIWLTPLMSWNILAFNIGATLYLTIGTFFEEQKLRMEYGEEYATYAKKTPMLMPGWGFWRK